jgi:hypothetical protein
MSANDHTFEIGAQKKEEEKKPANRHAPKRDYGGRAKILEIEASAKRKLEEMKAANAEVVREHEAAIQRARDTASDPVALRAYTLQRYKKLREDLEQEEEYRLADSADEAEDELRGVDLTQQATISWIRSFFTTSCLPAIATPPRRLIKLFSPSI